MIILLFGESLLFINISINIRMIFSESLTIFLASTVDSWWNILVFIKRNTSLSVMFHGFITFRTRICCNWWCDSETRVLREINLWEIRCVFGKFNNYDGVARQRILWLPTTNYTLKHSMNLFCTLLYVNSIGCLLKGSTLSFKLEYSMVNCKNAR